jgi:hypothetical protein
MNAEDRTSNDNDRVDEPAAPVAEPTACEVGGEAVESAPSASCRNAIKDGLRSRVEFPQQMAAEIEVRTMDFYRQYEPRSEFERFLVRVMAATSVQVEHCDYLIPIDACRVRNGHRNWWDIERQQEANKVGSRLARQPRATFQALQDTKQGVSYLLENWGFVADCVQTNNALNDAQREVVFDLLGVPHAQRLWAIAGCRRAMMGRA